jgi:hypothetical protein
MATDKLPSWDPDAADALKLAQQLREYHHKSLWEEEKHFTWLHSIILAAQAAIVTRTPAELEARGVLLIVLAIVGLCFVVIALRVVRREGAFFVEAHRLFVERFNALFPNQKLEQPPQDPNKSLFALPFIVLGGKPSIRDNFQLVFLVFGAIDLALLVAVVTCAV